MKFSGSLQNDQSVLQWQLTDDNNVDHYEIEYAENGISFSTAGKAPAKDHTAPTRNYQFTDPAHTFSAQRYYRLKMVQKGGHYTYSGIIRLSVKGLDIQVLPNPFDQALNVQLQLKTKETVHVYGWLIFMAAKFTKQLSH